MGRTKVNTKYRPFTGRVPDSLDSLFIARCKELGHVNKEGEIKPTKYVNELIANDLKQYAKTIKP